MEDKDVDVADDTDDDSILGRIFVYIVYPFLGLLVFGIVMYLLDVFAGTEASAVSPILFVYVVK